MTSKNNQGNINAQRRERLLGFAKAAAALAVSGFSTQNSIGKGIAAPKPEKRNITIATTNPAALPYLPLLVAQHKGFFAQQGLELQISEQQSAARAITAVGAGQADLVCTWLENVLSASGRALGMQSFVLLGITPMMALGVPHRPIQNQPAIGLAQLRGKKIGVVALNSPTHTVALAAMRRAGLRASDLGFVSVGSPASAQAALRSGQIDALIHMDPLMLQQEQRGELHIVADLRSPPSAYDVLGMHLPSSCLAAPQDFLQRFPGTAQACSDAMLQALQWLAQASLRDMLRLQESLPENTLGMDAQSFVASFERLRLAFSSDGICAPLLASNLLQAMHDAEPALRLEKIEVLKSVNNTLAYRSLQRLKA
ncbi:ABC transporter substrate-binding protein [Variovorax sp. PCZ-1]|uniref:ABC transporter substrate-binding protein n=1 Tax=Variovorax sp. PCZ-1 TaxID=2835533 RepID=UPI001BCB16D4|nr:ABC transporter substrate-binding protein [Variovorax sp. PCZ-1]MBS7807367.1 ABC transporter substrate-binding protein [Variovorax sp. PCZ-1]